MKRTLLIVDDVSTNRKILNKMLCGDYEILEAADGLAALDVLRIEHERVSAVLLDIVMPEMDGFGVLKAIREDTALAQIPVIIITGSVDEEQREKSLALGANDFIIKPYNPDVIRHCLKNNIALHETAEAVIALQRDRLTGLYCREAFFEKVQEMVSAHEAGYYIMASFDVDKFKVINDLYGTERGDEALRYIATVFDKGFGANGGMCCRVSADDFAVLYPAEFKDSDELADMQKRAATIDGVIAPITFSIGRYIINDTTLSPSAMYDRAMLAMASVKGRFDAKIAYYDESMRDHLIREQEIVTEMESALAERQFEAWYQPQYNHSTGALIGAEALVRWRHPKKGLIPPFMFIPVFEQNGFIYELDKYVWEEVCRNLKRWRDEGRMPLPVSVNVSRYDVFCPDIIDVITGLVKKYDLPVELLRIEITESAFSKSAKQIISVVKELISHGFTVEIDDFGSGFSSLNTLKDVPAQVLKLDMRFLESSENSERGGNIVESIVRMAKWLDMSVIAEGVETKEQADFLRSIGCNYIQGYLYAKPMPVPDYEAHCKGAGKEENLLSLETVENLDNNTFWDPKSMDTLIFNSYVGGACIYEFHNGRIELIRATEKYAQVIGSAGMTVEDALKLDWTEHLDEETSKRVLEDINTSCETKKEVTGEYVFLDLPGCPHETYLRSTMRVIAAAGERYLVYCTNENITAQRKAERREHEVAEEMRLVMESVNGGICAAAYLGNGDAAIIFANDKFYSMHGYTKEQYEAELKSALDPIYAEDREKTMDSIAKLAAERGSATYEYRCVKRDGSLINVCCNSSVISFAGVSDTVLLSVITDTTELDVARTKERRASQQLQTIMKSINGGISAITLDENGRGHVVFANDSYYSMFGYTEEQMRSELGYISGVVHPDDLPIVRGAISQLLESRQPCEREYRCVKRDGSVIYVRGSKSITSVDGYESDVIISAITDITALTLAEQRAKKASEQLETVLENINGAVMVTVAGEDGLRLLMTNRQYYEQLGYTKEQYESEVACIDDPLYPSDRARVMAISAKAGANGCAYTDQYRVIRRDGAIRWLRSNVSITTFPGIDEPVQLAVVNDVTEQIEAEQRVHRISDQMQAIMDNVDVGITATVIKDGNVRFLFTNDRYYEMLGYTRAQYAAEVKDPYTTIAPEDRKMVFERTGVLSGVGETDIIVYNAVRRDGSLRCFRTAISMGRIAGEKAPVQLSLFRDITEEKQAELRERRSAEQMQAIMDDIGSGITAAITNGDDTELLFTNDRYYEIHGYTREQYCEEVKDHFSLVHQDDRARVKLQTADAYESCVPMQIEYRIIRKDETIRWVRVDLSTTRFTGIEQNVHLCIYTDITARKLAERELRDSTELLQTLMDDTPGGFCRMHLYQDGSIKPVFFNNGLCKLLGMDQDGVLRIYSEDALAGVHPDDVHIVNEAVKDMLENGEAYSYRYRLRHGSGGYIWLTIFGRITVDGAGNKYLNIYYTDATEKVRGEEQQKELLDNLPYGAALYELSHGQLSIVHLNKRYWELVNRHNSEYTKASFMNAVHPDDRDGITRELGAAIRQKRDFIADFRVMYGEGGYRPFHVVGRLVPQEGGRYSIYATYTPISDETMSYQQMIPIVLTTIMESTTDLSFAKDKDLKYICASRSFASMVGQLSENDIVGKTDYDLFEREIADKYRADDERLLSSGKSLIDMVEAIPSADGVPHYSSTSKYLLRDAGGSVIGLYGIGRDITEYRDAFDKLRLLTDSIPGGIATYECTSNSIKLIYFNDGFNRLFGMTREEYEKRAAVDPMSMVFGDDLPALKTQISALIENGTPLDCVYRVHTRDGGYKWISHRAIPTDRKNGTVIVNATLQDITHQREIIERLRLSEEENNLAIRLGGNIICRYNVADRSLAMSPDVAASFLLPEMAQNVPYEPIELGLVSPETADAYKEFFESILRGGKEGLVVFQQKYLHAWRWLEARSATVFSNDGKPVKAVITFADVTDRLEKETVYKKWQQSLEDKAPESYTLFRCNLSRDASFDTVEGSLLHVDFDTECLSFDGRTIEYVEQCVFEEDKDKYIAFLNSDTMLASYYRGKRSDVLEYRETLQSGGTRWLKLTVELVEYPNSTDVEAYLMYENIDDAKQTELQTKELSETDPMTGVLNRYTFAARAEYAIRAAGANSCHALLMFDIDGFKQVNDVFGHSTGDKTLIELANLLRSTLRRDDMLGRLGGDEFIVFLHNIPDDRSAEDAAKRICALARRSLSLEVSISGSVGIAMAPRDGTDFETLYKKADAAMYYVKGSGKDNYAMYRENMADEHLEPEADSDGAGEKHEKKRRMLIVDDNMIDYALLTNIFKDDFIVESAKDGNSALIRLRHYGSAISVVLLDLMMPGMNGFAVLKKMRSSAELQSIPVIIVSGDESRETCLKTIRCGATDFITKPVDPELLRIRVNSAISKAENERLRAQNSFLELRNGERLRYEAALDSTGLCAIEYDAVSGDTACSPSVLRCLFGNYDGRNLWQVMRDDGVADENAIKEMQSVVHDVADDGLRANGNVVITLKTSTDAKHRFRMNARKPVDEYGQTTKIIITFMDLEYEE